MSNILHRGFNRQDIHQPLTDTIISYEGHTSIAQSFISHADNLNIVSMCVRNPGELTVPLEFDLHEATISAKPVRTLDFSSRNIDGVDCTRLQFEPIGDSAGKKYIAEVKVLEDTESHQGLNVESYQGEDYVNGHIYIDGIEVAGDLHFKTMYRQELGVAVNESMHQLAKRFTQDLGFFIPYLIMVGLVVMKIVRGSLK